MCGDIFSMGRNSFIKNSLARFFAVEYFLKYRWRDYNRLRQRKENAL